MRGRLVRPRTVLVGTFVLAGGLVVAGLLVDGPGERGSRARAEVSSWGSTAEFRFQQAACNLGSSTGCNNTAFAYDLGLDRVLATAGFEVEV